VDRTPKRSYSGGKSPRAKPSDHHAGGKSMKPEYDFSKGELGKFSRPNAELRLPIYLSADVQNYLTEREAEKGILLGEMVNTLLKQEIQLIE